MESVWVERVILVMRVAKLHIRSKASSKDTPAQASNVAYSRANLSLKSCRDTTDSCTPRLACSYWCYPPQNQCPTHKKQGGSKAWKRAGQAIYSRKKHFQIYRKNQVKPRTELLMPSQKNAVAASPLLEKLVTVLRGELLTQFGLEPEHLTVWVRVQALERRCRCAHLRTCG